jgi:type VI secretion system secreted protein VgrG
MTSAMLDAAAALRAQLAQYTQDTRLLRFTTSSGAGPLLVEHIEGYEGLSQGYRFDITALSSDAGIDLDSLLGQPALLQILTQHSRTDLRPIHGHITACERLGSDGGFTRYRLVLEPWTAFLRYRIDSYVWQGATIVEILEDLFSDYQGQGKLVPNWRFALADASQYPQYEVRTQFDESDWSFIERLLADEGLIYWFEHHADSDDAAGGTHQLVIGDHNGAFTPNAQQTIRFHRAAATEQSDSITSWHASRRVMTNAIVTGSWHEGLASRVDAQADSVHDNGATPSLTVIDQPGQRSFTARAQAERAARRQLEALEARNKLYHGESSVRTLAPATTFVLTDHAIHDADDDSTATFAVVSVRHRARNNLSSAARTLIRDVFANTTHAHSSEQDRQDAPLYQNHFIALRADIPWRPLTTDGRGALLHPKPTVTGVHTAIVVGNSGEDLTTERDHRIKVQMHWQRGNKSGNRRAHPAGADNAPGNAQAYVWVRIAEAAAGPNWGSSFTPRIGQEVLLDYLEGDIDRPIVIGSLYNGRGMDDAQGNQIAQGASVATGNAPAWFAGSSGEHAHNAVLSGFKTQEIGNSQDGQGGYNALILDDSTGQLGARLQTTQHATQLNLGYVKRQQDNARQQSHGHGAELTTDAFGAIRAGQGLLISADARPNGTASQMDAREAHDQLRNAHTLQTMLADTAQQHHAFTGNTFDKTQHSLSETVLTRAIDSLAQTDAGTGSSAGGGAGTVPAFGRPDLIISAPAGVALLTPADLHASAAAISITGGIDVSATMGRNLAVAVRSGISLFTYGDAKANRKTQGDKGIKLHAANGKVDVQAQSAQLQVAADKNVQIDSTQANVQATAKEHVLLTAGGAYVKIAGGNIEIHAPGSVQFKAAMKDLSGPARMNAPMVSLPVASELYLDPMEGLHSLRFAALGADHMLGLSGWAGQPYSIVNGDGKTLAQGTVSDDGRLPRVTTPTAQMLILRLGDPKGAQLVANPATTLEPAAAMPDQDEDTDDEDTSHSEAEDHSDDDLAATHVIANRYFSDVLDATSHHGTQFLAESDLAALIGNAS